MKKTIFTGSGVAIITPFTENGVDFDKLGELIEFHIAEKTDCIVICGTTGEASTMPDTEHKAAIKYTVKKVAGRIPVIAGTGSNDTRHCIELSQYAEQAGSDGVLVVTPYYNKTTQKGLIEHYTAVANSIGIPVVLYNVPGRTGVNITPQTLKELSKIENIVAIKEASGSIAQVAEMSALCGDDIDLYSGNDDMIVPLLSVGGKGVISVIANIAPRDTHNMVEKYLTGDVEGSKDLQLKMFNLIKALFIEVNPIPVKTAMNLLGYDVGKLRMPLTDMSKENLEVLKKALFEYGMKS
ncbi:MAG: 4-hydroxy-tetrahydrodipicolinate synthase [Firmicutes bacterium]|nr:4-hydroxy-tetrahydrodipicolinate synthase [Bacillota bacterium]